MLNEQEAEETKKLSRLLAFLNDPLIKKISALDVLVYLRLAILVLAISIIVITPVVFFVYAYKPTNNEIGSVPVLTPQVNKTLLSRVKEQLRKRDLLLNQPPTKTYRDPFGG